MSQQKFWVIWNEQRCPPMYKHVTHQSARAEAERLSRQCPGHKFHVLELMGTCSKTDVTWETFDMDSDIPF